MASGIVNVGYRSTSYYVVVAGGATRLLVDCGWPGTLRTFLSALERKGFRLAGITHVLVTHYHPDHAGLVQEALDAGATLLLMDTQARYAAALNNTMRRESGFTAILLAGQPVLPCAESRAYLAGIGIEGEIIATPGHSPDSVSLVLDQGVAFTGDLAPESQLLETDAVARESWARIRGRGARSTYPAHGEVRDLSPEEPHPYR